MDPLILRHDHNGLAILTLNRPEKLNALNTALFLELADHVAALADQTHQVGAVLLRGAGRCFSAGHDLHDIATGEKSPKPHFQADVIEGLANLPQPVITAVHGHCYTGALELALAGDIVVASESARFADTHSQWALAPVWGMSQRLPRRIGASAAKLMMFTAATIGGAEAHRLGLADLLFADDAFDAGVEQLTQSIVAQSWFTHRANKRLIRETDGLPLAAGLSYEIQRHAGRGPDSDQRIAAFTSKKR